MPPLARRVRPIAWALILLLLVVAAGAAAWWLRTPRLPDVAFSELLREVPAGRVTEVAVEDDSLRVTFRDGRTVHTRPPPGYVAVNPLFVSELAREGVRVVVEPEGGIVPEGAWPVILMLLVAAGLAAGGAVLAGRMPGIGAPYGRAHRSPRPLTFADVAGVDEARDEVQEIVQFLREPERFRAAGGRIPRGVLLVGPPGTGKTLLARAIAGEAGVPFLFVSGSDFVEKFVGVGASRVRRLFRDARRHTACIVFLDELDAVGRQRGARVNAHEEREQTLNQLLVEMDGFEPHHDVVVIAATNRADILDSALLRPGRFDRQVYVGLADVKGREAILKVHTRHVKLATGMDLHFVARATPGFSGADLANVVNEAALQAGRQHRSAITMQDFEAARDKVLMGVERRSLVMTPSERITCAFHEAGHAVVAVHVPNTDPLHKVTIVPRGRALGLTVQLPSSDRHSHSQEQLEAQLTILMGGRIAEEVFLRQKTSGAAADIEHATDIARRMVCTFGMSSLGMQRFGGGTRDGDRGAPISEHTARRVDEQVEQVLSDAYERARRLIETYRASVEAIADELLASETLDGADIRRVLDRVESATRDPAPL